MKRQSLVWPTYVLVALVATMGLVWLTLTAIQADSLRTQSIIAQQRALIDAEQAKQALLQEQRINEALWLADSLVAPLLANEAAIPWQYFEPFLISPRSAQGIACSPLMFHSSPIVKVHFQVDAEQHWQGPLYLTKHQSLQAIEQGVPSSKISAAFESIDALQEFCSFQSLVELTPPPTLTAPLLESEPGLFIELGNRETQRDLELPTDEQQQRRSRMQALNSAAVGSALSQQANQAMVAGSSRLQSVKRSPSRVVWVGDDLLQIRRIDVDQRTLVQGAWLDWKSMEKWLLKELQATFPDVALEPVKSDIGVSIPRQMVSLPVKLGLPPDAPLKPTQTPIGSSMKLSRNPALAWSLALAWIAFGAAVIGTAWLLHSALSLSMRRATFVSAVTHELRTPLTTFQLYTDLLLARDDLDFEKRSDYVKTLKSQSERLARLVENVLAYARLDGGAQRPVLESKPIDTWLEIIQPRLCEVVHRYQGELIIVPASSTAIPSVIAHQDMLEQLCLNLVENACKYGLTATDRTIRMEWRQVGAQVELDIVDHGPGIPQAFHHLLFQPFSRSAEQAAGNAPGIGLGLSLAKRLAKGMGGSLRWIASDQRETRFRICLMVDVQSGD